MKTQYFVEKTRDEGFVWIWRSTGKKLEYTSAYSQGKWREGKWRESRYRTLEELRGKVTVKKITPEEVALMF